jgi:acetyltransferase
MISDPLLGSICPARLRDGRSVLVRFARRGDEPMIQAFVGALSLESRYRRFFFGLRELPDTMMDRIVNAERHGEIALVGLAASNDGYVSIVGMAQLMRGAESPDTGEVAVVVAESWRRAGLGQRMLESLNELAESSTVTVIQADILRENLPAVRMATKSGADVRARLDSPMIVVARMRMSSPTIS